MNFVPSGDIRAELLASVTDAFERRFYEPTLHGVALRKLLTEQQPELLGPALIPVANSKQLILRHDETKAVSYVAPPTIPSFASS